MLNIHIFVYIPGLPPYVKSIALINENGVLLPPGCSCIKFTLIDLLL